MIGKTPKEHQMSIFEVALESFIDMNHELVLLSKQIDWEAVESEFAEYYCADNGRPSVPIRKMVGMMLLKNITFPTDSKLDRKIIAKVLMMSRKEMLPLLSSRGGRVEGLWQA